MNAQIVIGILVATAALGIGAWLLVRAFRKEYGEGYNRGQKDAYDWWTKVAMDVDRFQQPIKDEER